MQPRRRNVKNDWDWDIETGTRDEVSSWNERLDLLQIVCILFLLVCLVIRLSLLE